MKRLANNERRRGRGHGADRGADRRGRTRATALGGQGAVAPQPRPCRTSNDEKRVPRTRTVIRTHSAARGEARLTAEPARLAPASPTPDARRGSGATPSTLTLCSPAARTTDQAPAPPRSAPGTSRRTSGSPVASWQLQLAAGATGTARAHAGPGPGSRPARGEILTFPDTPTTQGLSLWCFNIVGGEILTFPDPCPRHSLRHSHYSRETQGLSLGIDP